MDGDSVASALAGLNLRDEHYDEDEEDDEYHDAEEQTGDEVDAVREEILADENLLEKILELISMSATRLTGTEVEKALKRTRKLLLSLRAVSKLWQRAAAKPLIMAAINLQLLGPDMYVKFLSMRRLEKARLCTAGRDLQLSTGDAELLHWLVAGYENGVNSVLSVEPGLDSTGPVVNLIKHFMRMGLKGPFLIVAPESAWPEWKDLLSKVGLSVDLVQTADELQALMMAPHHGLGHVVVLPTFPRRDPDTVNDLRLTTALYSNKWKFAVFDDRSIRSGKGEPFNPTIGDMSSACYWCPLPHEVEDLNLAGSGKEGKGWGGRLSTWFALLDSQNGSFLRLTHVALASDSYTLRDIFCYMQRIYPGYRGSSGLCNEIEQSVAPDRLATAIVNHCFGQDRDSRSPVRVWAYKSFLVPKLQNLISSLWFKRLGNSSSRADAAAEERPAQQWDLGSSLVGRDVRIHGLQNKPDLNGRYGYVRGFHEERGRHEVALYSDEFQAAILKPSVHVSFIPTDFENLTKVLVRAENLEAVEIDLFRAFRSRESDGQPRFHGHSAFERELARAS